MAFNVFKEIRKKSREKWCELLWEKLTDVRIWIQENGEIGFVAAIFLGILLAIFFRVFAFLLAIAVIVGVVIYLTAFPESELQAGKNSFSTDSNGVTTNGEGTHGNDHPEEEESLANSDDPLEEKQDYQN